MQSVEDVQTRRQTPAAQYFPYSQSTAVAHAAPSFSVPYVAHAGAWPLATEQTLPMGQEHEGTETAHATPPGNVGHTGTQWSALYGGQPLRSGSWQYGEGEGGASHASPDVVGVGHAPKASALQTNAHTEPPLVIDTQPSSYDAPQSLAFAQ